MNTDWAVETTVNWVLGVVAVLILFGIFSHIERLEDEARLNRVDAALGVTRR